MTIFELHCHNFDLFSENFNYLFSLQRCLELLFQLGTEKSFVYESFCNDKITEDQYKFLNKKLFKLKDAVCERISNFAK